MLLTFNLLWLSLYSLLVAVATLGLYFKAQQFIKKRFKSK